MTAESSSRKNSGLLFFVVILVIASIGVNVYLFSNYNRQDDENVVVMNWVDKQSWEAGNAELKNELTHIALMFEDTIDKQSWEASNVEIQDELAYIIEILEGIMASKNSEVEPDTNIPVMASVSPPTTTYTFVEDDDSPTVLVQLLPGDNVWSIVSRFHKSPSPAQVNRVVEYNGISDPNRMAIGSYIAIPLEKTSSGYRI